MRTVTEDEAAVSLASLLAAVAEGQDVIITRAGRPLARLSPVEAVAGAEYSPVPLAPPGPPPMTPERAAAIERMIKLLDRGVHLGGVRVNREELYER